MMDDVIERTPRLVRNIRVRRRRGCGTLDNGPRQQAKAHHGRDYHNAKQRLTHH